MFKNKYFSGMMCALIVLSAGLFNIQSQAQTIDYGVLQIANNTEGDSSINSLLAACWGDTVDQFSRIYGGNYGIVLNPGDYTLRIFDLPQNASATDVCENNLFQPIATQEVTILANTYTLVELSGNLRFNPTPVFPVEMLEDTIASGPLSFGIFQPYPETSAANICIDGVSTPIVNRVIDITPTSGQFAGQAGYVDIFAVPSQSVRISYAITRTNDIINTYDCAIADIYDTSFFYNLTVNADEQQPIITVGMPILDDGVSVGGLEINYLANNGLIDGPNPDTLPSDPTTPIPGQGQLQIINNAVGDVDIVDYLRVCVDGRISDTSSLASGSSLTVNLNPGIYEIKVFSDPFGLDDSAYEEICENDEAFYSFGMQTVTISSGIISQLIIENQNNQPVVREPSPSVQYISAGFDYILGNNRFGVFVFGGPDLGDLFPICIDGQLAEPLEVIEGVESEGGFGYIVVYATQNNSPVIAAGLSAWNDDPDCEMGSYYEDYSTVWNLNFSEDPENPAFQPIMFMPQPSETLFDDWEQVSNLSFRVVANAGVLPTNFVPIQGIQSTTNIRPSGAGLVRSGADSQSLILPIIFVFAFFVLLELSLSNHKRESC